MADTDIIRNAAKVRDLLRGLAHTYDRLIMPECGRILGFGEDTASKVLFANRSTPLPTGGNCILIVIPVRDALRLGAQKNDYATLIERLEAHQAQQGWAKIMAPLSGPETREELRWWRKPGLDDTTGLVLVNGDTVIVDFPEIRGVRNTVALRVRLYDATSGQAPPLPTTVIEVSDVAQPIPEGFAPASLVWPPLDVSRARITARSRVRRFLP
jgi:hypothetical protein